MKCTLDSLKVTVVLRLEINLTSCFNTKSSLIGSFKLTCTVTELSKQYHWVRWQISANILSCKFWYVMLSFGNVFLRWIYPCIYCVWQSDSCVWKLIFMYQKEVTLTLQLVHILSFLLIHYTQYDTEKLN